MRCVRRAVFYPWRCSSRRQESVKCSPQRLSGRWPTAPCEARCVCAPTHTHERLYCTRYLRVAAYTTTRVPLGPKFVAHGLSRQKCQNVAQRDNLRLQSVPNTKIHKTLTGTSRQKGPNPLCGFQQSSISVCGQLAATAKVEKGRERACGQVCAAREDCRRWRTSDPSLKPWPYCNPYPRYP